MTQRIISVAGYALLGAFLAVTAYIDLKEKKVHIWMALLGMALMVAASFVRAFAGGDWSLLMSSGSGLLSASTVFAVSKMTKGSVGEGDALIFAVCGLWFGLIGNLIFIWLSFFAAMLFGGLLVAIGKANRKTRLPLVPFAFVAWTIMGVSFIGG